MGITTWDDLDITYYRYDKKWASTSKLSTISCMTQSQKSILWLASFPVLPVADLVLDPTIPPPTLPPITGPPVNWTSEPAAAVSLKIILPPSPPPTRVCTSFPDLVDCAWPLSAAMDDDGGVVVRVSGFLFARVVESWSSCALLAVSDSSGGMWSFCMVWKIFGIKLWDGLYMHV